MQSLRVHDNSLEVFDPDGDVHVLLHMKVVKVLGVECDDSLKRLLQDLLAVLNLLCEAREDDLTVCRAEIELFGLWTKILHVFTHYSRGDTPALSGCGLIEKRMHHLGGLVSKTVCLSHAYQACF